jgi:hypothetical protein
VKKNFETKITSSGPSEAKLAFDAAEAQERAIERGSSRPADARQRRISPERYSCADRGVVARPVEQEKTPSSAR